MNDKTSQEELELVIKALEDLGLKKLDRKDLESLAAKLYVRLARANELISLGVQDAQQKAEFYRMLVLDIRGLQKGRKASGIINLAHTFGKIDQKSQSAKNSVKIKLANDPRQAEKIFVKECWDKWQQTPSSYKSKAAFARDMLEKCDALTSNKVIEDWCREWEGKLKTKNPAS